MNTYSVARAEQGPEMERRRLKALQLIHSDRARALEHELAEMSASYSKLQDDLIEEQRLSESRIDGLRKEIDALRKLLETTAVKLENPLRGHKPSMTARMMARRIKDFLFARDVAQSVKVENHED